MTRSYNPKCGIADDYDKINVDEIIPSIPDAFLYFSEKPSAMSSRIYGCFFTLVLTVQRRVKKRTKIFV